MTYQCDNTGNAYEYTRISSCRAQERRLTIDEVTTVDGVTTTKRVGRIDYQVDHEIDLSAYSGSFTNGLSIHIVSATGEGAETEIDASGHCNQVSTVGDCEWTGGGDFTFSGVVTTGEDFVATPTFTWTGALGKSDRMKAPWEVAFYPPEGGNIISRTFTPGRTIRCDREMLGTKRAGCVYTVTPVAYADYVTGASWQNDVRAAQSSGLPYVLHRATAAQSAANSALACKTAPKPRPAGYQCDEYPFASSAEGAAAGGTVRIFDECGMTPVDESGPVGWSICLIPTTAHRTQGPYLRQFYSAYRVIPGDEFEMLALYPS